MDKHEDTILVREDGTITLVLLGEIFDDVDPQALIRLSASFIEAAQVSMMRRIAATN